MPARLISLTLFLCAGQKGVLPAATVQERLESAVSAFRAEDYPTAHWQFEALELDFGQAPEFRSNALQQTIRPMRGYAALLAGRPSDAILHFQAALGEDNLDRDTAAFCVFNAALAQTKSRATARAAETFRGFRDRFPGTPEAGLALLQEAGLRARLGATEEAGSLLDDFYESSAPQTLRMRGRLRALQIAVETRQPDRSRRLLFETSWETAKMPDSAVLSFSALEVGDLLLDANRYRDAIRAYRHVLPRELLIERQSERLQQEELRLETTPHWQGGIWKRHARQQIARLTAQLEQLQTMPDYTPGLYLRFGQAYLLAGRHREAVLLFRTVAEDAGFDAEDRAQAHYRTVVALCQAEDWKGARASARSFIQTYPKHALLAEALFLVAHAYQGEGRYAEAVETLDQLIGSQPEAPGAPRWYFTRGYNQCLLEAYSPARASFAAITEQFPGSPITLQSRLWHGLTWFFERDYGRSLQELQSVRSDAAGHPEEPEATYRLANLHYALSDYDSVLEETGKLLGTFPGHHRAAEARALRGDALMGLGELVEAAAEFRKVPAEDERLFDYATFQTAKIFRALDRPDLLEAHLLEYIGREDAVRRPRLSEALFWLARSMGERGQRDEAESILEEALLRFGDDPTARGIEQILESLADLHRHDDDGPAGDLNTGEWIRREQDHALEHGRLTWFARLTRFAADRERRQSGQASADGLLLSIDRLVPLSRQDASCLAAVGIVLAERGYRSADAYFEALLVRFPDHAEIAAAYYGKARLAEHEGRIKPAYRWVTRFLEETPMDPLAGEARLLHARILQRKGHLAEARAALDDILAIKALRGRTHARAIASRARLEDGSGDPERAIACWQRLYTLYRAYPELLAEAYWESARLFEAIDDHIASRNTLVEMLADERLHAFEQYAWAKARLPELEAHILHREAANASPRPIALQ